MNERNKILYATCHRFLNNNERRKLKTLLERTTAKTVIDPDADMINNLPSCPVCKNKLLDCGQHFCEDCGQKLDWTDFK